MKNTNINNTNKTDDMKYILMLCQEQKDLVLKTEFGIGRYQFTKFNELHGNTVLEFELLEDNRYKVYYIDYPYFDTKYFNDTELLKVFDNNIISPPFYGSIFTIYAEKK